MHKYIKMEKNINNWYRQMNKNMKSKWATERIYRWIDRLNEWSNGELMQCWQCTWYSSLLGLVSDQQSQDKTKGFEYERKHYKTTKANYQNSHSTRHQAAFLQRSDQTQNIEMINNCKNGFEPFMDWGRVYEAWIK